MYKRYTQQTLFFISSILILIAGFNFIVDPFNIFRNFNEYTKNEITTHLRLFKAIALRHQKANILLFGDSQVEHGINPQTIKKITNKIVFNASFSSMQIYELRKYIEFSLNFNKPEVIIVGLQMYNFLGKSKYADDYNNDYLNVNFNPYSLLLSIDTVKSSFRTLKQTINDEPSLHNPYGVAIDTSKEAYKDRFIANEKHYLTDNAPKLNFFKYENGENVFSEYSKILYLCHKNKIKLLIFISPSHARQLEATDVGNTWKTFENWKKQLVELNIKVAKDTRNEPFNIWDFSGYHSLVSESIPHKSNLNDKMRYYYESSHYTPALGDIVLDRILDSNISGGKNYLDFGIKLTADNIETHLGKLKKDRKKWQAVHIKDVIEIKALKK